MNKSYLNTLSSKVVKSSSKYSLDGAIGNDRESIKTIYGDDRFLDISNLNSFPNRIAIVLKNLV